MLRIDIKAGALRFVQSLPPKQYRQVVRRVFALADNPLPHDSEKVHGTSYRRVSVGEYRIVYTATEDTLRIVAIGKRNDDDVYRRLKRSS